MDFLTLRRILADLIDLNYDGRIHPYGNGEPLTDPEFLERVKLIKKSLPKCHIYISTNGDYINKKYTFRELFDAGIDEIQCNHYDDKNEKLKLEYYPNVEHINIGVLRTNFYNRAGNINIVNITPSESCWFPGKKLYFNYKGEMLLCCSDWQFKYPIGNIQDNSIMEMLESPKMQEVKDNLCPECNLIKH